MILLANMGIPISTASVYNKLNLNSINSKVDVEKLINYIEEEDLIGLGQNMTNVMEQVVIKEYPPIVEEIKRIWLGMEL